MSHTKIGFFRIRIVLEIFLKYLAKIFLVMTRETETYFLRSTINKLSASPKLPNICSNLS